MSIKLRQNAFTEAGFQELDTTISNTLKRGRNGQGYEVGFRFDQEVAGLDDSFLHEATFTSEELAEIRNIVSLPIPSEEAVVLVSMVVIAAKNRARLVTGQELLEIK